MSFQTSKKFPLTVVDLFAGCGGLSLGLEQAGFQPIFVNELNDQARATYLLNRLERFPHLSRFCSSDVKEIVNGKYLTTLSARFSDEGVNQVDLVCGGPPCQGFSRIGHRRSYGVDREQVPANRLYKDMAQVIRKLRPKMFLFENVGGLKSARWTQFGSPGEIWEAVLGEFQDIRGYHVEQALVRASDYGVPQNRPRVLIVGILKELDWVPNRDPSLVAGGLLPTPTRSAPGLEELLGDLVDPAYVPGETRSTPAYPRDPSSDVQRELRTLPSGKVVLSEGDLLHDQVYSRHSHAVLRKFRAMQESNGVIPEKFRTRKFSQRLLKPAWEKGPNITATSLPDDYVHWDPSQPRTLTVREWARLQTFPDWYQFCGPRTTGGLRRAGNPREGLHERELPKYTQIGNAVPVALAKAIGLHFASILVR